MLLVIDVGNTNIVAGVLTIKNWSAIGAFPQIAVKLPTNTVFYYAVCSIIRGCLWIRLRQSLFPALYRR